MPVCDSKSKKRARLIFSSLIIPGEWTVRRARVGDLKSINELTDLLHHSLASLYGLTLSDEALEEEHFHEDELANVHVAEDAEAGVVGYMSIAETLDEWAGPCYELEHLVVKEEFRGRGVARKLFDVLLEKAGREKVNIKTGTLERNTPALRFYEELDFKPLYIGLILDLQKRIVDK